MIGKWLKICVIGAVSLCVVGGLFFGKDLLSYVRTSAKSVRRAVKGSVPIEFELRRAHDLLEEIIPEMHANISLIAQEEVEIAALRTDIDRSKKASADERERISKLSEALKTRQVSYTFGEEQYPRTEVKKDLAHRFELFREAELVLASKGCLLASREKSLQAAMQLLDRTRAQKRRLLDKIEGLESQYRFVRASAVGSRIQLDNSKVAQTERLIAQIKKRLDVSERILAHESRFVQAIPVDTVTEKELLTQIDDYFGSDKEARIAEGAKESQSLAKQ